MEVSLCACNFPQDSDRLKQLHLFRKICSQKTFYNLDVQITVFQPHIGFQLFWFAEAAKKCIFSLLNQTWRFVSFQIPIYPIWESYRTIFSLEDVTFGALVTEPNEGGDLEIKKDSWPSLNN